MSGKSKLFVYHKLDFFKKYNLKFLFISFIGIHIPLLGVITYLLYISEGDITPLEVGLLTLVLTLIATALTLFILNELLKPLKLMQRGLEQYSQRGELPQLPTHYQDEVGQVMAKTQQTLEQLQLVLDEKQDLLSLLSHDLRSPVNQIKGFAMILQQAPASEDEMHEYLESIDGLCTKHARLLDDVLFVLRHEESKNIGEMLEDTELISFLEKCIQYQHHRLEQKEIIVKFTTSMQEVFVPVNQTFFQQAFQNLIENAIKFSYPKSTIDISVGTVSGELYIQLKDHGMGFPPEIAPQLFDRFTRQGRKGTMKEPSTGLGLHLSRKIIEQHAGQIEAFSEGKDKGATFTIKLKKWSAENTNQELPQVYH